MNRSGLPCKFRSGCGAIKGERGVTLLELVLSLTILGILLPTLALGITVVLSNWNSTTERLEARAQAILLLQRIEPDIRSGTSFAALPDGGLQFSTAQGRRVRYQLTQSGLLLRDEQGVGVTVLASKLKTCTFTPDSNGTHIRLQLKVQAGKAVLTLDQTYRRR